MCPERICKDCEYVFYPLYIGQYMTCFCTEPVSIDWTPEYNRIIEGNPEKIIETGEEFPCCMGVDTSSWQKEIKQMMLFMDLPGTPTLQDYSLYYKKNVEWKQQ